VPGTYTLTVIDATKPGYTFDVTFKLRTSEISVGTLGNVEPVAAANSDITSGSAPLSVAFDGSGSSDADGTIVAYNWQFGDGGTSTEVNPSYTYVTPGAYTAILTVTDDMGATNSHSIAIEVTDAATGCLMNCIRIDQIAMRYRTKSDKLTATVVLLDENDKSISQANIDVLWTLPDGSTQNQSAITNKRSKARFNLNGIGPGIYTARVTNISKPNYVFDKDNSNVLTGMIELSK
jgi:PKD repeat protein